MKFLVDTGASSSFINPKYTNPKDVIECRKTTITTILNKYDLNKKIILPTFIEFKQPGEFTFLVFNFHNYFDGLLGLDILTQLEAKVDLLNKFLETKHSKIMLHFKPNFTSGKHIVPSNSKIIVKIPVDVKNGDIIVDNTEINDALHIPEGIYHAENWQSLVEVINTSEKDTILYLEQPLKVTIYNCQEHIEIFNFETQSQKKQGKVNFTQLLRTDHLHEEEKTMLLKLCKSYKEIFYREEDSLSFTNKVKHRIMTTDDIPIYTKSYRYPYVHKIEVNRQISEMLKQKIIRPSYSPWSSPVWIVPKKLDASGKQKWRLVIDYRRLNEKTISDRYPLPNINEILDKLGRCMYFTTLDLASGFHQIEMDPRDIQKTAFTVEGGHFEYIRMPFGLKNAPSTFQRVMDNVLEDLIGKVCLVYLDDIIIFATSLEEHIANLKLIFERLRTSNFKIQLDKSEFLRKEITFLGHIVSTEGIKPNPEKIDAIQRFPIPQTKKDIKSFIGLLGYYRKFIKDFAKLTKPLTKCLKKDAIVDLSEEYVNAFETSKAILMNDPLLQYPDFGKPFVLTTDASNFALGAVLSQGRIGSDKPVCYASRTLSETETNYSTIEKELLAIVWATKYFRPYLFGHKFFIVTDHKPLTWLMSLKEPNSKLIRWRLKLEEFDYEIIYKKGKLNLNADALSRIKLDPQEEVNLNDTISEHGTSVNTIHSADENMNDGISISEKPLNEFNLQIILEKTSDIDSMLVEAPFVHKKRRIIKRKEFSEEIITDIFKQFLAPNKLSAIFTDNETFKIVQSSYSKYFSNSRVFRLIRCTEVLEDVANIEDQERIIKEYHQKNNHRGINESLSHLKRKIYFPYMKNKITQIINNCDTCALLKYDRSPPKPKFEKPETPTKPLDIIHIDVYTINGQQILTMIDKFSKFAAGYTLESRTTVCILRNIQKFINLYGIPRKIVSDQGSEFTSSILKDFCRQYQIDLHYTSFQQSSSNSPVERLHSSLTEIYRIIFTTRKENHLSLNHNEIITETLITYNNAIHSTTKHTPYELFFGRTHKFNMTVEFNNEHEYLTKLNEFQANLYPLIKDKMEKLTSKRIDKLNENRSEPDIIDNVTIFRKENRRNKITPRFSKHKAIKNNKVTLITAKNQKLHKSKIRRRHKNIANQ